MSDTDLPCRGDCQCPESQVCISRVCKKTSKPSVASDGTTGGHCNSDGTCDANTSCVENVCGERFCRAFCIPGSESCDTNEICESLPGDAGTSAAVCTP